MAFYDLKEDSKVEQITNYLAKLISDKSTVELRRVKPKRTNSQNAYLHVLFTLWGLEHGYTVEEAKTNVKRHFHNIFVYEKKGHKYLGRTRDMDTKQMTDFIDQFRNWSASEGYYLPSPDEYKGKYAYYQNIIEINKEFL